MGPLYIIIPAGGIPMGGLMPWGGIHPGGNIPGGTPGIIPGGNPCIEGCCRPIGGPPIGPPIGTPGGMLGICPFCVICGMLVGIMGGLRPGGPMPDGGGIAGPGWGFDSLPDLKAAVVASMRCWAWSSIHF